MLLRRACPESRREVTATRHLSYLARPAARDLGLSCRALPPIAAALDASLLLLSCVLGDLGYQIHATSAVPSLDGVAGIALVAAVLFGLTARMEGLYRLPSLLAPIPHLTRIAAILAVALLGVVCVLFLLKIGSQYSRGSVIATSAIAFAAVPSGRVLLGLAARAGIYRGFVRGRRVVTLGDAVELEGLQEFDFPQSGIDEVARISLQNAARASGAVLSAQDRERIGRAIEAARESQADEFAVIMPWSRDRELAELCSLLRASPLSVRLYPDRWIRGILRRKRGRDFGRYFSVEVQREPLSWHERALKRAMDVVAACVALVVLAPFLEIGRAHV